MRNFEVNKGLQTWTFSGHLNIYKKQTFSALSYHFRISSEKYSRNSYLLTYPNSISRKIFPWSTFFHSFPQRLSMNLVHSHPHPWQPACSLLFIHKTLLTLHDTAAYQGNVGVTVLPFIEWEILRETRFSENNFPPAITLNILKRASFKARRKFVSGDWDDDAEIFPQRGKRA